MDSRMIGALAGVVGILGYVVWFVPDYIIPPQTSGRAEPVFEGVLPMFGTPNTTIRVYTHIIDIVVPLVLLALGVGLGYYVAQRVTFDTEYRRVAGSIAAGSMIGVVLGLLWVMSRGGIGQLPDDAFRWFSLIAGFVIVIVEVAVPITVGAVAGAAITHFRSEGPPPAESSDTTTDPPTDAASTTRNTDGSSDSRPVNRH